MAYCMRLTTLLALLCLPVRGVVLPSVGTPISKLAPPNCIRSSSSSSSSSTTNSTSTRSSSSSTRSARVSPPRAIIPGGGWSAMEVTAAREALINSEGFKILAKRAADRLHCDEHEGEDRSTAAAAGAAAAAIGHGVDTSTSTDAPGILSRVGLGSATIEEDATATTSSSRTTWKRNADKLKSLRTTVLDSDRAREITGKLRLVQLDNNNRNRNRSAAHRLEEIHGASPPRLQETIQNSPQGASYDSMAASNGAKSVTDEGGEGEGEGSPGRLPGIRLIRRIATRVSHVGRQAINRGRVARVYSRESGKTDDMVRRDA